MGITIGKAIPVHWVNTTYTSVDVIGSGGVYTGVGGSRSFRECKPGVNQWGQAGLSISYTNDSDKTIKYIVFTVVAKDSVDSSISEPIRVKETGPIKPHTTKSCQWDYMWQNGSLKTIKVLGVSIEYMDGTSEVQAANPKNGQRKLQVDSAASYGWTSLISVAAIALLLSFMVMRANGGIARISKMLLVIMSVATVFVSQRGVKPIAILFGTIVFALSALPVFMNGIVDVGSISIMLMNLLMLFCTLGVFQDKKMIVMAVAFGVFCAIVVGSGVLSMINNHFSGDVVGDIIICVMNVVFLALAWLTGIRCRYTKLS